MNINNMSCDTYVIEAIKQERECIIICVVNNRNEDMT